MRLAKPNADIRAWNNLGKLPWVSTPSVASKRVGPGCWQNNSDGNILPTDRLTAANRVRQYGRARLCIFAFTEMWRLRPCTGKTF